METGFKGEFLVARQVLEYVKNLQHPENMENIYHGMKLSLSYTDFADIVEHLVCAGILAGKKSMQVVDGQFRRCYCDIRVA